MHTFAVQLGWQASQGDKCLIDQVFGAAGNGRRRALATA